jgi:hypothetical protein
VLKFPFRELTPVRERWTLEGDGDRRNGRKYSLDLLDLLESKGLKEEKAWSIKRFIYRILQIGGEDIKLKQITRRNRGVSVVTVLSTTSRLACAAGLATTPCGHE